MAQITCHAKVLVGICAHGVEPASVSASLISHGPIKANRTMTVSTLAV